MPKSTESPVLLFGRLAERRPRSWSGSSGTISPGGSSSSAGEESLLPAALAAGHIETTPFVARQLQRLPGAGLVDGRVGAVVGGVAMGAAGVCAAAVQKQLEDDLEYGFPLLTQLVSVGLVAAMVELLSGPHALFARTRPIRMMRLLPLVALFALSTILAHLARRATSVHGALQVAQALLPLVVLVLVSQRPPSLRRRGLPISAASSSSSFGSLADDALRPGAFLGSDEPGRRLVAVMGGLGAIATWAPANVISSVTTLPGAWAYSISTALFALLSVMCTGALLVGASRQAAPAPAAFVRHFAPLCLLVLLGLWPLLESPVEALARLDASRAVGVVGAGVLGAISWGARLAMLTASVSDGVVGVSAIMQAKSLACLGVGWWAFGYPHSWLQSGAFVASAAAVVVWTGCRLLVGGSHSPWLPGVSHYRPRKASTAAI
ncbi:hypothetical protein GGF46_003868 [Coemansia sp. RSA 552]|nr:hypothetical protein GGF46_003868 [Coemansia sp. RSA 552]